MIGASSSPMAMFTAGGGSAGPSMYDIGYNGSPGGAISNALRQTIDRYHATLNAQQEQADKLAQIQATSSASLGNDMAMVDYKRKFAAPDPDASGPFTQVDPNTGKSFIRSTSVDPTTGMSKVSWSPVSINAPEDPVKTIEGMVLKPTIDQMRADQGQGNIIQRSAGATVPTVQGTVNPAQSNEGMIKAYMQKYPSKSRQEIVAQMKAKGLL